MPPRRGPRDPRARQARASHADAGERMESMDATTPRHPMGVPQRTLRAFAGPLNSLPEPRHPISSGPHRTPRWVGEVMVLTSHFAGSFGCCKASQIERSTFCGRFCRCRHANPRHPNTGWEGRGRGPFQGADWSGSRHDCEMAFARRAEGRMRPGNGANRARVSRWSDRADRMEVFLDQHVVNRILRSSCRPLRILGSAIPRTRVPIRHLPP